MDQNLRTKLSQKYDELFQNKKTGVMSFFSSLKVDKSKQKANVKKVQITVVIIVVLMFLYTVNSMNSENRVGFSIITSIIPILVPFGLISVLIMFKTQGDYKKKIIEPLIKELDFVEEAFLDKYIDNNLYEQANFQDKSYNIYRGSNYIKGKIDEIDVKMSNLVIQNRETYTYDGKTKVDTITRFKGFVIIGQLNKKILDGYVSIFADKDDKAFIKKELAEGKIHMDSMEFEQEFDVYSSDSIKALMILTSDLMQKLLEMKTRFGKYEISISNNIVAIRIYDKTNMFIGHGLETDKEKILNDIDFILENLDFIKKLSNDINNTIS